MSAVASRWLSLASSQNGVPVVREITVELTSAESARQIELRVTSAPAFIYPMSVRIDRIDPTGPRTFQDLNIQANHEFLAGLTEAYVGSLCIEALIDGQVAATYRAELRPKGAYGFCGHTGPVNCAVRVTQVFLDRYRSLPIVSDHRL